MKSVVITGSTKGIGLGMAEEFLKHGHAVTLSSRSTKVVAEEAQRLGRSHGDDKILGHPCDVSDISQVQSLWDAAHRRFGKIDVWINNAGLTNSVRKAWELDPAEIQAVINTNLLGLMYGCQIAVQGMLKQGFGQIYNFLGHGSTDELRPGGLTLYGTTKRAVRYFTEALIEETRGTPVQIGFLNPGTVITDLIVKVMKSMPEAERQQLIKSFNIVADTVETVAPFLVEGILNNKETGAKIEWMTIEKFKQRQTIEYYQKRDLFKDFEKQL